MEYIAGSLTTFIGIAIVYFALYRSVGLQSKKVKLRTSQSYTHKMFAPILLNIRDYSPRDCQSLKHYESNKIKILFTQDVAYWIKDNAVFCAEVDPVTGLILEGSEKEVDMMGMDKVQLDEMMFIVEQLTEGQSNDSWRSGDS